MDKTIEKLLRKHYEDGPFHTHVSLINPKGKFQFNRQGIEEFWGLYCKNIYEDRDVIIGVGEKSQQYLPVLVDVDIKLNEEDYKSIELNKDDDDSEYDTVYSKNHVERVVEIYQSVLRNIVEECNDIDLTCVLLEKQKYKVEKNDIAYIKSGFHLHFPYIFLNKIDQEVHLIPRVQSMIKDDNVFLDLGIEDSSVIIDKSCCKVPWLVYGSRKSESMEPYRVSKVYNSDCVEISLTEAFKYYKIYDMKEQCINIGDNVEYYLPRILSILPYGRDIKELKHGLISPIKQQIKEKTKKNNIKVSVTEALKISENLLPMLSQFRVEDFNEWMTVGWILYNIGDGCDEALEQWLNFSARDESKYDESKCIYEWERMVKKGLTLGTLKWYASIDNPEAYNEYKKSVSEEHIRNSINGCHNDIAKALYAEYGNEFVCASVSSKTWYQYINHKWEEIDNGITLQEKISNEIVNKFTELGKDMFNKLSSISDKAEEASHNIKIKLIQKMISNLKSAPYKANVMKECIEVFYDKRFKEKLNKNPYLFAFKNGVYDLKLNIFRKGIPEDFLSRSSTIEYVDFNEHDDKVHEVYNYLEKVFPDKSIRSYFMDQASDVFVGGNHQKVVHFWTGEGDNAKSVTQNLFEKMLGPLAIKLPTTVLTGKKPTSGSAHADLARTGDGVRWATAEEPDGDEMINTGTLKHLSGNDSYFSRDLFEKGKDTKEIVPLFKLTIICNKLPRMKYADKATWNRVRVIPFESTFCRPDDPAPELYEEQLRQKRFPMDPNFSKKIPDLIQAFAWVLLEHRKKIIGKVRVEPDKVKSATALYRKQNDIYRQFIDESIIENNFSLLSLVELYTQFKEWFKESFPGQSIPVKNEVKEYFCKTWGEPNNGFKWKGFRIRNLQDDIQDGNAIVLDESDLIDYEEDGKFLPPL